MPASIEALLARLSALHPVLIDLSLERALRLLAALGSPHLALPPAVHVAGTNGKGSTVAFLRAIAEAAGWKVHVYTSPHLVQFNERIRLAGTLIDDDALCALLEEVETVNAGAPVTFFEIVTCAAFAAFARVPADLLLLETGMGGRLDATNTVPKPTLTMLTPIDYDHQNYLGSSLSAIAAEKAGILKPGVPCIAAAQRGEALAVVEARARETNSPLCLQGRDFAVRRSGASLLFTWNGQDERLPLPALPGPYQIDNAGNALAAAAFLGLPQQARAEGMRRVEWPARLQRLTSGPLSERLPAGWELWLDGAHNPHAGRALATFLPAWQDRPLDLVVGMLETKDEGGFLAALAPFAARVRTVPVRHASAGRDPGRLADAARREGIGDAAACASLAEALTALATAPGLRRVLIVGSLYLAGEVLAENAAEDAQSQRAPL